MNVKRKPRVLIGKIGLDGHTTGIYVVSKALSDAGIEVIFGGIRLTPGQVASTALQESVDLIGISSLSGAHMTVARNLINELREKRIDRVPIVIGGIIPPEDITKLKSMGVTDVFTPGTPTPDIVARVKRAINANALERRPA